MHLADNEHKFYLKVKGEKTGQSFEGDFVVKCILNHEEQIDVAIRVDRYNAGSRTISPNHALMNRTIAELEVRIKVDEKGKPLAPTWWVENDYGRLLYDTNILYSVFAEATKGESIWRDRIAKKAEEAEEDLKESDKAKKDKPKRAKKSKEEE